MINNLKRNIHEGYDAFWEKTNLQRARWLEVGPNLYPRNLVGQLELVRVDVGADLRQADVGDAVSFDVGESRPVSVWAVAKRDGNLIDYGRFDVVEAKLGNSLVEKARQLVAGIFETRDESMSKKFQVQSVATDHSSTSGSSL